MAGGKGAWKMSGLVVRKAGTLVGKRMALNLIEGTGVTITVGDDPTNREVDVTIAATGGGGGSAAGLLHVRDEQASGTNGGTFTSGAFQTRTLNTTLTNEITGASLASNEVTLPAGTYEVDARTPAVRVGRHQARLYDVTNAVALVLGSDEYCDPNSTGAASTDSTVRGRFTLVAEADVRLEHRCQTTFASAGFGLAHSWGTEVYADLMIRKVA